MRILHTSDWHLGQNFFSKSRKSEHQAFIGWLLQQVGEHNVDAVLIAGDVFDTGTPPSYARELYHSFIVEMSRLNCQLLILGGNHDSVSTLNETKGLLAYLDTQVIAGVSEDPATQIVTLKNREGEPGAIVCAIPFIRPRDVLSSQAGESIRAKQQALGDAIQAHYHQLHQLAIEEQKRHDQPIPIIATGHLTALGVKLSESVRDIYVGSLEAFPAQAFPPVDYIALGHIHRPQIVAKSKHIRYSGSPIPLSFDELKTQKSVFLADFADGALKQVTPLLIPRFQAMQVLKGNLSAIEEQLNISYPQNSVDNSKVSTNDSGKTAGNVDNPDISTNDSNKPAITWLSIEVETNDYLTDLQQRIQSLCEGLPVDILQLRRARADRRAGIEQVEQETLNELSVEDIFERRLALETFEGQEAEQRRDRIRQLYSGIVSE
ncbi:MAG: Exonuclease SbcD, partial [uncultured Thiotrichaceae bacterium]